MIPFSFKGKNITYSEITDYFLDHGFINVLRNGAHLIITGGEPLLQIEGLSNFVSFFYKMFKFVPFIEVETNGTIVPTPDFHKHIGHYNVSMKTSNSGMSIERRVSATAMEWFSQCSNVSYKCVIFKQNDIQEYNDTYFKPYNLNTKHILLMPAADSRVDLQELEKDVVEWCKDYGYRYSSRLHIQLWDKKTGV